MNYPGRGNVRAYRGYCPRGLADCVITEDDGNLYAPPHFLNQPANDPSFLPGYDFPVIQKLFQGETSNPSGCFTVNHPEGRYEFLYRQCLSQLTPTRAALRKLNRGEKDGARLRSRTRHGFSGESWVFSSATAWRTSCNSPSI